MTLDHICLFLFCFFNFYVFIFGCAGSLMLCGLRAGCHERGLLSSCSAWASRCGGFSLCRAWAPGPVGFSSCSSQALEHRLNSCGVWAQLHHGMWDFPGAETEPVSPALAGRFFTTKPPRMSHIYQTFSPYLLTQVIAGTFISTFSDPKIVTDMYSRC